VVVKSVVRSEGEGDEDELVATEPVTRIYTDSDVTSSSHLKETQ